MRAARPLAGADRSCTLVPDGPVLPEGTGDLGRLHCWGDGDTRARPRPEVSPELLRELAVGNPSCAVQESSGRLVCWGANESGQLGDGTRETRLRATRVTDVGVPLRRPRVARFGERGFACAIDDEGGLRCWGAGERGQLGDGVRRDRLVPELVRPFEAEGEAPVPIAGESLALGAAHACALLDGNAGLVCWGANDQGQLGDGTFTDREVPTRVRLPGLDDAGRLVPAEGGVAPVEVYAVALGRAHSCAVVGRPADGRPAPGGVLCWGDDGLGQLGDGTPGPPERSPRFVRGLEVGGELGAAALELRLALGQDHGCVTAARGGTDAAAELWCWGASAAQQTGLALGAPPPTGAVRVAVPNGLGVRGAPSLGRSHGCVVLEGIDDEGAFLPGGERRFGCWGGNA
ncbi:MAG: hypothetical protein AAF447_19490, partial [Myxococcota bacterium]